MTSSTAPLDRRSLRNTRWFPLGWAAVAAVAQLVFVSVLAPNLPSSFLVWFNANRAAPGDHYYRFATADFVTVGWVFVAVFAAAALVCFFAAYAGGTWTSLLALVVSVTVPLLIGLLYGSVFWQLGLDSPAQEISSGIGVVALALGVIGLFVGLATFFLARPRVAAAA